MRRTDAACVAPTRAEAGCINYDLHQRLEDKEDMVLYENWRSKEDLDEHLEMPYLQELKAKAEKLCSQPIEISIWEMITNQG